MNSNRNIINSTNNIMNNIYSMASDSNATTSAISYDTLFETFSRYLYSRYTDSDSMSSEQLQRFLSNLHLEEAAVIESHHHGHARSRRRAESPMHLSSSSPGNSDTVASMARKRRSQDYSASTTRSVQPTFTNFTANVSTSYVSKQ